MFAKPTFLWPFEKDTIKIDISTKKPDVKINSE